jgi:hypothetical protein
MKVKHYVFSGLDFVFDKKGNPWFIEANYFPGVKNMAELYDWDYILGELSNVLKKHPNPCVLRPKRKNLKWNSYLIAEKLRETIGVNVCFAEDNLYSKDYLITDDGRKVKPGIIFRPDVYVNSYLNKNTKIINSNIVRDTVNDKMLTINIVKNNTDVRSPRTFFVRNRNELKNILRMESIEHGFVLKPIDGSQGKGVCVLGEKDKKIPRITRKELVEERITPKLIHRKYWDARVYVINGKFIGGELRESRKRVTNISLGAKPYKLPKRIANILKEPSLKIVAAIDKYCDKKLKESER